MPGFTVDSHPEKRKIIEGILAGRSVREISVSVVPHLAHCAVQRYKAKVINPLVARAAENDRILNADLSTKRQPVALVSDTEVNQAIQSTAHDAPVLSLFRSRVEKLHGVLDRSLGKAEQRNALELIAPLANAQSKNLEMLGRATGELEQQGGTSVSIQVVCPSNPTDSVRISYASPDAIEATSFEEIGLPAAPTNKKTLLGSRV